MHIRGKFVVVLSCFCTLGHGEASGESKDFLGAEMQDE